MEKHQRLLRLPKQDNYDLHQPKIIIKCINYFYFNLFEMKISINYLVSILRCFGTIFGQNWWIKIEIVSIFSFLNRYCVFNYFLIRSKTKLIMPVILFFNITFFMC